MPLDIQSLTSETTVVDGELPLSAAQIDRLVELVAQRLEVRRRQDRQLDEATSIRRRATPGSGIGS